METLEQKLLDETRVRLEALQRTIDQGEGRRAEFDRRQAEIGTRILTVDTHLASQDRTLAELSAKLGLHLTAHESLRRARLAFWGGAGMLIAAALALAGEIVTNSSSLTRLDDTVAAVAIMGIACNPAAVGATPELRITCGQAIAVVHSRLGPRLYP